jgi:ferritin
MLKPKLEAALNQQLNEELFSAYLYLAMSADFQNKNLPGFASWMSNQAQEEMSHAQKFYAFILDRGGKVQLQAIAQPQSEWASPSAAFEAGLNHERHISECIHNLYALAEEERDYPTRVFLHFFIEEQVEEEATAEEWVEKVKRVENDPSGLFSVDKEAGTRTFDLALAFGPAA